MKKKSDRQQCSDDWDELVARSRRRKPMTPVMWGAAVSILMERLGASQTAMALVFNDPENLGNAKIVAPVYKENQLMLQLIKNRLS